MKARFLAAGALSVLMVSAANATVYFDSTTVENPFAGSDGLPDSNTYEAASFAAGTPNFSAVSLMLSDASPDTGSVMVYLVPDNGAGGSVGVAGAPVTVSPANTELIGTISDSQLSPTPSLTKIYFTPSSTSLATANQEYWIELIESDTSNATWEYGGGGSFVGSAGQENVDSYYSTPALDGGGVYDMIVSTPEPASLAILGVGLAALGQIRRRGAKGPTSRLSSRR